MSMSSLRSLARLPIRIRASGPHRFSSTTSSASASASVRTPISPSRRLWTYSALLSGGIFSGWALATVLPRPQIFTLLFRTPTPPPLLAESEEGRRHTADIELLIQNLPLVQSLREAKIAVEVGAASPAGETSLAGERGTELVPAWRESRPYAAASPGPHSLSAYTLRGPGKFAVAPLVFTSADKQEGVFFMHLGTGLCGHEGVVHGGLLATILDEALARTAFMNLPRNIGVTATLELSYRKPTFADAVVVIRTKIVEVKGRKAWVTGRIETVGGELLVEAKGLFVEPRMAAFLSTSSIREALK